MFETFVALLFAHLVGDFVLQSKWMVDRKGQIHVLLLHVVIHLALSAAALGTAAALPFAILALTHFAFDFVKIQHGGGFAAFMSDQAGHLAVIAGLAVAFPSLFSAGSWAIGRPPLAAPAPELLPLYLSALIVASGLIATLLAARYGIEIFMSSFALEPDHGDDAGLPKGGLYIGLLERALVFLFVLTGQFTSIGFLIAAKSVLRFGVANDRKMSEYVIIGTLLSFGWAIATASLTRVGLDAIG